MSRQDRELMRVLCGEMPADALNDSSDRARAEAAEGVLREALAAPAVDREALHDALNRIDSEQRYVIKAQRNWLGWAGIGAAALLAIGVMGAVFIFQNGVRWPPGLIQPVEPFQKAANAQAHRQADGSWKIGGTNIVPSKAVATQIAGTGDGGIVLREGRANIVSDTAPDRYTRVLAAFGERVVVNVRGKARYSLRLVPGQSAAALSVFEGGREAVLCAPAKEPVHNELPAGTSSVAFSSGANSDALIAFVPGKESAVVRWLDTSSALPPAVNGDIYLRLKNGRLLRGVVTESTPQGIRIRVIDALQKKIDMPEDPGLIAFKKFMESATDLRFPNTIMSGAVPESLMSEEIAAWTPAETPRGRDVYSRWIGELLPRQLENFKTKWRSYLALKDIGMAGEFGSETIIPENMWFPDVEYSIRDADGESFLLARPLAADLGGAWEMDEQGNIREAAAKTGKSNEF